LSTGSYDQSLFVPLTECSCELKKSPHLDAVRRGASRRAPGGTITRRLCVTLLHAIVMSIT